MQFSLQGSIQYFLNYGLLLRTTEGLCISQVDQSRTKVVEGLQMAEDSTQSKLFDSQDLGMERIKRE